MTEILQKIRDAISGKKTIITAVIGILTAALAWAGGELTDWQALAAVWVAIQIIFIRTGAKKDASNVSLPLLGCAYHSGNENGYTLGFSDGYEQGDDNARYEDE